MQNRTGYSCFLPRIQQFLKIRQPFPPEVQAFQRLTNGPLIALSQYSRRSQKSQMTLRMETFDQIRANVLADRAQFFTDLSAPFYGANRPGATVSQGL